jgi:GntR family transcriptional regulator
MEFSENKPIYLQIADRFFEQILKKKWTPEKRIPSVRDIAVMMEVNPNTAIRAFHYLQEKKILYNRRGVGYFLSKDAHDKVKELKREEFIQKKLPHFVKEMKLLGFTFSELNELYKKYHDGKI